MCISSASERKETWINVHPLLGHPVSVILSLKTLWAGVKHWRTAPHRFYVYRKPIPRSRNLKVIKKICTFEVHLCMMSGQLILSGKPFNTFSMARLKILQLRLTLTPLSNTTKDPTIWILATTHGMHFSLSRVSHHFSPWPWSVIGMGYFFLFSCLLLIHRYLWNSQKWQILIQVNRDLDFFYFLRFVTRTCDLE